MASIRAYGRALEARRSKGRRDCSRAAASILDPAQRRLRLDVRRKRRKLDRAQQIELVPEFRMHLECHLDPLAIEREPAVRGDCLEDLDSRRRLVLPGHSRSFLDNACEYRFPFTSRPRPPWARTVPFS